MVSAWERMLSALAAGHETGDYDAFASRVRDCALAWYIAAYAIDRDEAESLANDVAVKLWVNAPRIQLPSADRYIRRAIANTGRTYLRQRKTRAYVEWDIRCASNRASPADGIEWHATLGLMTELEREVAERLASGESMQRIRRSLALTAGELDGVIESIRRRLE